MVREGGADTQDNTTPHLVLDEAVEVAVAPERDVGGGAERKRHRAAGLAVAHPTAPPSGEPVLSGSRMGVGLCVVYVSVCLNVCV